MIQRKIFYLCGSIMFIIFIVNLIISANTASFSLGVLSWFGLSYMFFVIGYIQPQVDKNDERAKYIKRKVMSQSMLILLTLLLILSLLTQIINFTLDFQSFLAVFIFLSTIIIFTMWIIVSIRN